MKKLMLSMLVVLASTVFVTSAFAQEDDAIIWGAISIESDYYIYATNTSTSQPYSVLIHADHSGVNYVNVPPGNYNILISIVDPEASDISTTWGDGGEDVYYLYGYVSLSAYEIEVVTVGHSD